MFVSIPSFASREPPRIDGPSVRPGGEGVGARLGSESGDYHRQDLGVSGKAFVKRSGFDRLNAEVALGRVGILLSLEVSRLARSNADWYHLLDMCALTDTLLAHAGAYVYGKTRQERYVDEQGTVSRRVRHLPQGRVVGAASRTS